MLPAAAAEALGSLASAASEAAGKIDGTTAAATAEKVASASAAQADALQVATKASGSAMQQPLTSTVIPSLGDAARAAANLSVGGADKDSPDADADRAKGVALAATTTASAAATADAHRVAGIAAALAVTQAANGAQVGTAAPDGSLAMASAIGAGAARTSEAMPAATVAAVSQNAGNGVGVPLEGIAVEIAARAVEGKRRFEIRLDPPELGRIDVRLDVARDGQVTSRLMVERPETLDLLRRDSSSLERALQSTGLRTDDGGLQFSLRDQSSGGRNFSRSDTPPPNLLIVPDKDVAVHEAVRRGYGVLRGLGGGVDISI